MAAKPPEKRGTIGVPAEPESGSPCEICGRPVKIHCADHDHATGMFRGWVCHKCNRHLAALDEPGWMKSAEAYLTRARKPVIPIG